MRRRRLPSLLPFAVWLLLASTSVGCSYFNAFYNTKHYFKTGEQERERSTDLNSKPAGYTKAVDAGGRLIEYYPESKYIDDALFIMGQSYYWLQDYHKALRKFEELQSNYPDSPFRQETQLWIGRTNVKLKKRQEATSQLRGLIGDTEDPALVSGALFALAELYYDDSLFVKAEEEFAKITETADDEQILGESYWRAGEAAFREERYESAVKHLSQALKFTNTRSLTFQIQLLLGRSLLLSGEPKQAVAKFDALLSDKRYYEEHGRVRVQLALAMVELGRIDEAMGELDRVIENYKRSDAAAQAYYEKGMIQLRLLSLRKEAKENFDKGRVEKSRSLYALKADTMLNLVNRVDDLGLNRKKIVQRIDITQEWIVDPIDPQNDSLLQATSYFDSLAFDSLHLLPLFMTAYRDSLVLPEVDTTSIDSIQTDSIDVSKRSDSTSVVALADSISIPAKLSVMPSEQSDTLAAEEMPIAGVDTVQVSKIDSVDSATSSSIKETRPIVEPLRRTLLPGTLEDASAEHVLGPAIPEKGLSLSDQSRIAEGVATGQITLDSLGTAVPVEQSEPVEEAEEESGTIIRLFDPQPVLDSLNVMRSSLQEIRFQLGEVLLFDLNQPDSARTIFNELAHPPNADSVQARAILALVHISNLQGDSTQADSLFHVLADDYAATRHGKYARNELGRVVEEVVKPDEDAFREAEKLYLIEDDPNEAFTRYRWLVSTYPESPYAPKALFASAWIAGDIMNEPELAEDIFNEVAETYPSSDQAIRAEAILTEIARLRNREAMNDSTSIEEEFADIESLGEDEVDSTPEIVGDISALSSILESRQLLPQEVIQGTGGEVLLRYIVDTDGRAEDFRVVMEDPPGRGLARALITGLEEVTFRPGMKEGEKVVTRVERRYTLPLDAPPNVRPLPRRRR
ncbi:tetratricopeptide repeat protein [bacterium]|nr:tetratricopeptide repeat protein [bacterium]